MFERVVDNTLDLPTVVEGTTGDLELGEVDGITPITTTITDVPYLPGPDGVLDVAHGGPTGTTSTDDIDPVTHEEHKIADNTMLDAFKAKLVEIQIADSIAAAFKDLLDDGIAIPTGLPAGSNILSLAPVGPLDTEAQIDA